MDFFDIIQKVNQDCKMTQNIKDSVFTESKDKNNQSKKKNLSKENKINTDKKNNKCYQSIEECILYTMDPMITIIPNNERYFYYKQLIIQICSEIDENTEEKYTQFNYIKRIMNKNKIQSGLQMKNMLSSLLYLSDYYKYHFVIIKDNNYYETSFKKYDKRYIIIKNTSYQMIEEMDLSSYNKKNYFEEQFEIENNLGINTFTIYQTNMKAISNYKLSDLVEIAEKYKLSTKMNGKNKKKKDLYNEINIHLMNH